MKAKKFLSGALVATMLLSNTAFSMLPHKVYAAEAGNRIEGATRYGTAKEIALKGWANGAETVIIANGAVFADALASAGLSAKYDAPILLTKKDTLNDETKQALQALAPSKVIIIGGTAAVSTTVENQIKTVLGNITISRIAGQDRYETSVKIAEELGNAEEAFVVTGDKLPDAMTVASLAARKKMPIILTKKDNLPQKVSTYINDENAPKKFYVIGGPSAISNEVASKFSNSQRIAGNDRYETNAKFIETFKEEYDMDKIYLANGQNNEYTDAIPGAALASKEWAPIVFVKPVLSESTKETLNNVMTPNTKVVAFGGTSAVSNESLQQSKPQYEEFKTGTVGANEKLTIYSSNVSLNGTSTLKNAVVLGNLYVLGNQVTLDNVTVTGTVYVDTIGSVNLDGVKCTEVKVLAAQEVKLEGNAVKVSVETRKNTEAPTLKLENTKVNKVEVKSNVKLAVSDKANIANVEVKEYNREKREVIVKEGTLKAEVVVNASANIVAEQGANVEKVVVEKKDVTLNVDGTVGKVEVNKESTVNIGSNAKTEISVAETVEKIDLNVDNGADITVSPDTNLEEKVNLGGEGASNVKYFRAAKFAQEVVQFVNQNYTMKHFNLTAQDSVIKVKLNSVEAEDSQTLKDFYNTRRESGVLRDYFLKAEEFANQKITGYGDLKLELKNKLANRGINLDSDFSTIVNAIRDQGLVIENLPNVSFNGVKLTKVEFGSNTVYDNNRLDLTVVKSELNFNKSIEDVTVSELKEALNGKTVKLTFENGETLTITFEK
jgi:N-acetylmuramoyl-L-alanine amidase